MKAFLKFLPLFALIAIVGFFGISHVIADEENPDPEDIVYYCGDVDNPYIQNGQTGENCQEFNEGKTCVRNDETCIYGNVCDGESQDPDCIVNFCGDSIALNYETYAECHEYNPIYTCIRDDSICTYPAYNFCDDLAANNGQTIAACQAAHPGKTCVVDNSECVYPPGDCEPGDYSPDCLVSYCGDVDNPIALNAQTQADCQADHQGKNCERNDMTCTYCDGMSTDERCIVYFCGAVTDDTCVNAMTSQQCRDANDKMTCVRDDSLCECYAENVPYCPTDPDQPETCQWDNPDSNCVPDNDQCELMFCGYDVIGQYTFKGVIYEVELLAAYWFDPNIEACVVPDEEELEEIMSSAFDPLSPPPPEAAVGNIPIIPAADQCENINGDQSYDDFINGGYQRLEGGDCSVCDPEDDNCLGDTETGQCNPALTELSPDEVTLGQPLVGNIGCSVGNGGAVSTVNDPFGDSLYLWSCYGDDGSTSCTAEVGQCPEDTTYCYGECISDNETCEEPVEPCPNPLLCSTGGKVLLRDKLKVTPIINPGDSCIVSWGKDVFGPNQGVFIRATTTTRCTLSDQNSSLYTFDVEDLDADTSFTKGSVLKDENFVLKCFETNDPDWPAATATGSCRLNVRPSEFN